MIECPECHEQKKIPEGDFICFECRNPTVRQRTKVRLKAVLTDRSKALDAILRLMFGSIALTVVFLEVAAFLYVYPHVAWPLAVAITFFGIAIDAFVIGLMLGGSNVDKA